MRDKAPLPRVGGGVAQPRGTSGEVGGGEGPAETRPSPVHPRLSPATFIHRSSYGMRAVRLPRCGAGPDIATARAAANQAEIRTTRMINAFRKLLRPTLRQQLEDGVREALRRYADRRTAPDLRVYALHRPGAAWDEPQPVGPRRGGPPAPLCRAVGPGQRHRPRGAARGGRRPGHLAASSPTTSRWGFRCPGPNRWAPATAPARRPRAGARARRARPRVRGWRRAGVRRRTRGARGAHAGGAVLEVVSSETLREAVRIDGEVYAGAQAGAPACRPPATATCPAATPASAPAAAA